MGKLIDLTGQKFGRWTALNYVGLNKFRIAMWLCYCECGKEKSVAGATLRCGESKSCGCYRIGKLRLQKEESAFNQLYSTYKKRAKKRNLIFILSREQFSTLTKQECYYCGKLPQNSYSGRGNSGGYTYNGIDRVDNDRGYELDNCVSCCKHCNTSKSKLSQSDFFKWIKKIAEKHIILEKEKNAAI